jgi:polyisoprenoid-binding protein YceI
MKNTILSIAVWLIGCTTLQAQIVYATKSAQIKFDAAGGLEAIAAKNNQVNSKMVDKTGQVVFSMLIKSFKFANQLMEDHFNENYLESTKFPKADFKGYIKEAAAINFSKDGTHNVTAEGELNIHGVTKKVTIPGTLTVADGKVILNANFKVKLKEYGIAGLYIGDKIAADAAVTLTCKYD